ncbi:hypothetical protein [Cohnella nanjingensis]|uniref:Uncharacterized protein n=1 Tax=Cohnella nanjingensis TaxID=1387779 RepID=A0A7X0RT15_9BACL|nr:hypothetical protein [Cohnella nanjingensis]MBB6672981.1 hypothetical protein [Cohnella nanjingensis]
MKKKWITLLVIALLAGVITILWRVDENREIVFEVKLAPDQMTADGKSSVNVQIQVTNTDGTPRSGDDLQIIRLKGHGQLSVSRVKTDRNGHASFVYFSYRASSFTPAMTNEIMLSDVSVGKIVGVYKRHALEIPVLEPAGEDSDKGGTDGDGYISLGG